MNTKQISVFIAIFLVVSIPVTYAAEVDVWAKLQSATTNANVQVSTASATGTTSNSCAWEDPQRIERPLAKQSVDYNCDKISNLTIEGSVPSMVEAGQTLTVAGRAAKKSSTCKGFAYHCRMSFCHQCRVQDSAFSIDITCQGCPKGYPKQMECVNEIHKTKTMNIVMLVVAVAALATAIWAVAAAPTTVGAQAVPLTGTTSGVAGADGAVITGVKGVTITVGESTAPLMAGADGAFTIQAGIPFTTIGSGSIAGAGTTIGGSASAATAAKLATATAAVAGFTAVAGSIFNRQPTAQDCHSVCTRDYWTDGFYGGQQGQCAARPTCSGEVIATKECEYACDEGICGIYAQSQLSIEVKNMNGDIVDAYTTRTDAKGKFSYTFTAPEAEGRYAVVIKAAGNES